MIELKMERLPAEICLKIFCFLDSQSLATALQVCRKWNFLASDNILWSNLFKERWGEDHAAFYHPVGSKSWKDSYEVQDRCDRFGLGLRIIREGSDYYLIHQGEIQRHLGSRRQKNGQTSFLPLSSKRELLSEGLLEEDKSCRGILDRILFFIGDLEVASTDAKRSRAL
ncbi:F-box protein SKIP31-like isoform X1 [Cucurbita moschata]|uniref:F-box protein n=1 Tax=Cucurbita moschata TaxID=3662 RepID=A0A6J1EAN4_CUCMO|nr:F-box protein SKIP31-like isoform X1 [Cucurbita moschata]